MLLISSDHLVGFVLPGLIWDGRLAIGFTNTPVDSYACCFFQSCITILAVPVVMRTDKALYLESRMNLYGLHVKKYTVDITLPSRLNNPILTDKTLIPNSSLQLLARSLGNVEYVLNDYSSSLRAFSFFVSFSLPLSFVFSVPSFLPFFLPWLLYFVAAAPIF